MGDKHSNGPQFSKIITIICLTLMVGACWAAASLSLSETVAAALIASFGCLGVTSVVWLMKKSQTENTVKIYMEAYKEVIKYKHEMGEETTNLVEGLEGDMLGKMTGTLDDALSDSTSLIEKQEVI